MMVFKMSYGANDVQLPLPAAKASVIKKAAPRRRTKATLTDQAQALFDPPPAVHDAADETTAPDTDTAGHLPA